MSIPRKRKYQDDSELAAVASESSEPTGSNGVDSLNILLAESQKHRIDDYADQIRELGIPLRDKDLMRKLGAITVPGPVTPEHRAWMEQMPGVTSVEPNYRSTTQ